MPRLSSEFLQSYVAPAGVETPAYDRTRLKAGWVHLGTGNFFRAHAAAKLNTLLNAGNADALRYGIVAVYPSNAEQHESSNAQNGLYTVAEQDVTGANNMRVVGSVTHARLMSKDFHFIMSDLTSSDTRVVSLTITPPSHGKYVDEKGDLNLAHPDIVRDLDVRNEARTVIGLVGRAIVRREIAGASGFTILNLDNMEHNGDVIGKMVRQFVEAYMPTYAPALDGKYTFPNSMVDRIVPGTNETHLAQVAEKAGFEDRSVVPAEPMPVIGSWVLEGKFANGFPDLESLGLVHIVPDVLPYEKLKLRILNATHSMIATLGDLAGMPYVYQAFQDADFRKAVKAMMDNETGPTLPPVPGIDLEAYKQSIIDRFANEKVLDTMQRVAKDAPLQVVLDTARDQIAAGGSHEMLALNVAAWLRRYGVEASETGSKVEARSSGEGSRKNDNAAVYDVLNPIVAASLADPRPALAVTEIFGDIGRHEGFAHAVQEYMEVLDTQGVKAALNKAVFLSNTAAANKAQRPAARAAAPSNGPDVA